MTKAQHTPGPWQAIHALNGTYIVDGNKFEGESGWYLLTRHHPNRVADGALIASAPELLAALERLVNVTPIDCDYHGLPIDKQLDAALTLAESAIAKAKGIEQ